MLNIIHIFICVVVGCVLLTPLVLPFWKVWARLKSHHPDIWHGKGPFDVVTLLAHGYVVKNFFEIIALAEHDEELKARDGELVKWARVSREMLRLLPQGFMGQVGCVILFLVLTYMLGGAIMEIFS
ncbi:MAG: hypothetical protein H3C49_06615 [Alphaproteobacteria bacterium]|nr:hypothetical protein [Alphaproteobacteria bacterium]HRI76652.1 hypothetical protein [Alphaproteobacteria bacterium]